MTRLAETGCLKPGAIVVAETDASQRIVCPTHFEGLLERSYGKPKINIFAYCPSCPEKR